MFEIFEQAVINHVGTVSDTSEAAFEIITENDFSRAIAEIPSWNGYAPTPLHSLSCLADKLGLGAIMYKDEGPRFGLGSFKALGGSYAGLLVLQRELSKNLNRHVELSEIRDGSIAKDVAEITLVSATDGNHGRSLAWGAQAVGAPCRIYIHKEVSEGREKSMRDLGAEVIRIDGDYDESVRVTRDEAEENGWFVVSDTSWEGYTRTPTDVMAGYGVMIDEIIEQSDHIPSHLFVQGGVGGLAAAMAARLRQKLGANSPRIIVVEPELAACLYASGKVGEKTIFNIDQETMMAGLSCGEPSDLAWEILASEASDYLTIPESLVAPTMRLAGRPLGTDPAIQAGESAVAGMAALIALARNQELREKLNLGKNSSVLLIGSEGATDAKIYQEIMENT